MEQTKQSRSQGNRSNRRPGRLYLFLSLAVILVALVLALTVFFRVHEVVVVGNVHDAAKDIAAATGISAGDNLFFVDLDQAAEQVLMHFPYLREVTIRTVLPDKIHLQVTEREPVGAVESSGMLWIVDSHGKILEGFSYARAHEAPDVPRIVGVELSEVYVGGRLTPADESLDQVTPVLAVMAALRKQSLNAFVDMIRINTAFEITLVCGERYTVRMKIPCDIDQKIDFLARGLEKLETQENGVIDLTVDKVFRFIPQSVLDLQEELAREPVVGEEPEEDADAEDGEDGAEE